MIVVIQESEAHFEDSSHLNGDLFYTPVLLCSISRPHDNLAHGNM